MPITAELSEGVWSRCRRLASMAWVVQDSTEGVSGGWVFMLLWTYLDTAAVETQVPSGTLVMSPEYGGISMRRRPPGPSEDRSPSMVADAICWAKPGQS